MSQQQQAQTVPPEPNVAPDHLSQRKSSCASTDVAIAEPTGIQAAVEATAPQLKQTGFPKGEPDSLYHRDSSWISSYHIQNSFQSNITNIAHVYNITWFIYYIIQMIVI